MLYRIAYKLIKSYSTFCIYILFKRVEVYGKEYIPDGPLIFSPNHQNAFLDGIITSCLAKKDVSFLARADVFKVKVLQPILRFFQVIPVYRMRDGASEMSKNYETFSAVQKHLNKGKSILIFPEGNQKFMRFLRPLKKGIFRILDQCKNNAEVPKVVPVGINYEHHTKTGYNLIVCYAPHITYEFPLSNGFVEEKKQLRHCMIPLTQQLDNGDLQSLSESAWLNNITYGWESIEKEKHFLEIESDQPIMKQIGEWRTLALKHNLLPEQKPLKAVDLPKLALLMLAYAMIAPFRLLVKGIMKKITAHNSFRLSMSFGFTLFLAPFYLLLLFGIFQIFFPGIYFLLILLACLFFAKNKRLLDQFTYWWQVQRVRRKEPESFIKYKALRTAIRERIQARKY